MKKKGRAAVAAVVLFLCAGYLFYTRPVTLGQIYPMLEAGECVGMSGVFRVGSQQERSEFTLAQGSEAFEEVLGLLYDCRYRRTLSDQYWYGELDFHFNGQTRSYRAKDEKAWAADLLEAFG